MVAIWYLLSQAQSQHRAVTLWKGVLALIRPGNIKRTPVHQTGWSKYGAMTAIVLCRKYREHAGDVSFQ